MRRVKLIGLLALMLAMAMVLPSCSIISNIAGSGERNSRYEGDIADRLFEQILDAIDAGDEEAIQALFSEQALVEAEDLDENTERLFALVQGDIVSWEREVWSADISSRQSKRSKQICSWYTLNTTKDTYSFFLLDYSENKIEPELEGLYTLRVAKHADEDKYFTYAERMKIPGIYVPEEYFAEPTEVPAEQEGLS